MKYIVLFISGVKMLHSFREPSVSASWFSSCSWGRLLPGATVEEIYSNSLNNPDHRGSFDRAKTWMFNEKQEEIVESPIKTWVKSLPSWPENPSLTNATQKLIRTDFAW